MTVTAFDDRLYDLVDADVRVEQIATGCVFTEGPLWDPRDGSLLFSDTRTAIMRRWSDRHGVSVFRTDSNLANGNTWDRDGHLITCEQKVTRRISRTLPTGELKPWSIVTAVRGSTARMTSSAPATATFCSPTPSSGCASQTARS